MEFVVVMSVFLFLFIFSFQLIFVLGSRVYIDHRLYQSLFCLAQGHSKIKCENDMVKSIKKFIVLGNLTHIKFKSRRRKWKGTVVWKFMPWTIRLTRKLKVPEDLLR